MGASRATLYDLESMPIEDASVPWPEDHSPYVPVARITIPPQVAWSEAKPATIDDRLAFNPRHGPTAHRPIGSIMRARKMAYRQSAQARAQRNARSLSRRRLSTYLVRSEAARRQTQGRHLALEQGQEDALERRPYHALDALGDGDFLSHGWRHPLAIARCISANNARLGARASRGHSDHRHVRNCRRTWTSDTFVSVVGRSDARPIRSLRFPREHQARV